VWGTVLMDVLSCAAIRADAIRHECLDGHLPMVRALLLPRPQAAALRSWACGSLIAHEAPGTVLFPSAALAGSALFPGRQRRPARGRRGMLCSVVLMLALILVGLLRWCSTAGW